MNIIDKPSTSALETLFKAISHPARLAILEELRKGEFCVCHLEALLGFRQAYVSQQLAVLRDAGLIIDRREGWNVYYRVVDPRVYELFDIAYAITGTQPADNKPVKGCSCHYCNKGKESTC
ncbi:transcriptional regulator [Leptolinea sp. HRD-7]|nr:transcriptional regulator [Leptolinea sp. HRD-7]